MCHTIDGTLGYSKLHIGVIGTNVASRDILACDRIRVASCDTLAWCGTDVASRGVVLFPLHTTCPRWEFNTYPINTLQNLIIAHDMKVWHTLYVCVALRGCVAIAEGCNYTYDIYLYVTLTMS